jgi:hypothetical protein
VKAGPVHNRPFTQPTTGRAGTGQMGVPAGQAGLSLGDRYPEGLCGDGWRPRRNLGHPRGPGTGGQAEASGGAGVVRKDAYRCCSRQGGSRDKCQTGIRL